MKIITLSSYKGGVGKTTSSICLASLFSQHGQTLLIDSDPNRSASTWARAGNLPFKMCSENTATKLMGQNKFDFVVIDTPARPVESELQELAEGCDLLLLPTTPDSLSMDALALMTQSLPNDANYRVLLTMIPPPPEKDGADAFQALKENGFPVLERGIRRFKVYKDAAALGQPVYKIKGGKKGMAGLDGTGKTQPTSRASRFSEILKFKQAQEAESEVEQPSENLPPDEEPPSTPEPAAPPAPVEVETKAKVGRRGKVSKRKNPDYMQAIFHLPVKTSKRLDRELLDLGEAGVNLDRSEFAEELLQSFFRLSEQVGADDALKQFRNLGSK